MADALTFEKIACPHAENFTWWVVRGQRGTISLETCDLVRDHGVVVWHSPVPEGKEPEVDHCPIIGGPCRSTAGALVARPFLDWAHGGDEKAVELGLRRLYGQYDWPDVE